MCFHWLGQLISATSQSKFSILKHVKSKHRSALTHTSEFALSALSGDKGIQTRLEKNYSRQELPEISP